MAKYLSNRQQKLNVGISSYTESQTVLEVTGKVGIGTTDAHNNSLYVIGSVGITSDLDVSRNLKVSGLSTFTGAIDANGGASIDNIRIGIAGNNEIDTSTGNLTIDSADGNTIIDDNLDVSGNVDINDTSESTSTSTGALRVDGGVGIAKNLNVGGNLNIQGNISYTESVSQNLSVTGIATFTEITVNGHSELDNVNIVGTTTITGQANIDNIRINGNEIDTSTGNLTIDSAGGNTIIDDNLDVSGNVDIDNTSQSTSTSTGALRVDGGVGIAKNLNVGGDLRVAGLSTFTGAIDANGGASIDNIRIGIAGNNEIDTSTGNLTIDSADGNTIIDDNLDVSGDVDVSGNVDIDDTSQSTSTSTGALRVDGGVGIAKNLNVGGDLRVAGISTFVGNVTFQGGTINLGDASSDNVVFNADVNSDILPNTSAAYDIGISTKKWRQSYFSGIVTSSGNSLTGSTSGSTLLKALAAASGTITVPSGTDTLVGRNTTDTLTNKTVNLSSNTLTGTTAEFNAALSNGDFATLAGAESITNKVLLDGNLNAPGKSYYVSVNGSDTNTGTNLNRPFASIVKALTVASSGDTILVGPGLFTEVFPIEIPVGVTIRGAGLRSTFIEPTSGTKQNDGFLMNGETTVEDLTVGNIYEPGYAFKFADNCKTTTRSPYIQRVTVLNKGSVITSADPYGFDTEHSPPTRYKAGRGVLIDGSVCDKSTLEPAMLFNECTFITPNNTALEMTNGARTEWVNCFTYFADKGIHAYDGTVGLGSTGYVRVKTSGFSGTTPTENDELYYLEVNSQSGTYSQVGTALTITRVGHGLTVGDRIYADFTTGTATDGFYRVIEYVGINTFSVTTSASATTSGDVSYKEALGFGTVRSYTSATGLSSITAKGEGLFELPSSRISKTVTGYGNASLSSTQKKFGTASLALDGSGDYAYVSSNTDFAYGTGDFTIELWFYPNNFSTDYALVDQRTSNPDNAPYIEVAASTGLVRYYSASLGITTSNDALSSTSWNHIAVSRSSGTTKMFINGNEQSATLNDTTNYESRPLKIGVDFNGNNSTNGYIDELRISNVSRYTGTFTTQTSAFNSDGNDKILLHFDGITGSVSFIDSAIPTQDVRWVRNGVGIATATRIILADYQKFGAEMRSIGSAVVFGNTGVSANGPGVGLRLFAFNFGHIGSGKDFSQDISLVNQESEVIETDNANVYFVSIDQSGDFRVGDAFYVSQDEGTVNFGGQDFSLNSLSNLSVTDGANTTIITPTSVSVGNIQIFGNDITTTSGNININPSGNSETFVSGNLNVTGILTASVLQTSALQINDTSIALDDTGSNGTIRLNTDDSEALRITNNQNVLIGDTTETGTSSQPLQVTGGAYVSGDVGIGTTNPTAKLDVRGTLNITGVSTFQSNVYLGDDDRLYFGNDDDFYISHDGNNTYLFETGTGALFTRSNQVLIQSGAGVTYADFKENGAVDLYYNGSKKFETTSGGVTVTGTVTADGLSLGDSEYAYFGAGNDLQIYHDGSENYIDDAGVGSLLIRTLGNNNISLQNSTGNMLNAVGASGAVELYYGNSKKFETTGVGVSILNGTSDTATIYGPSNLIIDPMPIGVGTTSGVVRIKGDLYVDGTTTQINSTTIELADFIVGIATTATSDLLSDGAGIQIGPNNTFLYEYNGGTNPSLKSSENLNIASGKVYQIAETERLSADTLSLGSGATIHSPAPNELTFGTNGQERVRIDASGDVGIGTALPEYKLDLGQLSSSTIRLVSEDNGTAIRVGAGGESNDVTLLRVDGTSSGVRYRGESNVGGLGFSIKYMGSRTANNNSLSIFGDNGASDGAGSQVEAVTVLQDGKIGIGSTVPDYKLSVLGDIQYQGAIIASDAGSGNLDHLWHNDDNSASYGQGGTWHFVSDSTYKAGGNSAIRAGAFANMADTGTASQKLQITGGAYVSGNLGVGATNPQANFVVSNSGANGLEFDPENSGGTNRILSYNRTTGQRTKLEFDVSEIFVTDNQTEYLRLNSTGLGIGTDNPTAKLDVRGDIVSSGNLLPLTDNSGVVGSSSLTWNNGQFTNLTIDSTLSVRSAIDLADGDVLRFGSSDDVKVFYDGTANDLEIELEDAATQIAITDNTTYKHIITKDGKVGINTSITPTVELEVNGNANISGILTAQVFYGSGIGLTGIISNEIVEVQGDATYYPMLSPVTSGTIPNFSVSSTSLTFVPSRNALGIGTTNPTSSLHFSGIGNTDPSISDEGNRFRIGDFHWDNTYTTIHAKKISAEWWLEQNSPDDDGVDLIFYKSRGLPGAEEPVQLGDNVFRLTARAYKPGRVAIGTNITTGDWTGDAAGQIEFNVDDVTSSMAYCSMDFKTRAKSRLMILSNGNIGIGSTQPTQPFQIGYAGTSVAFVVDTNGNIGLGTITPTSTITEGVAHRTLHFYSPDSRQVSLKLDNGNTGGRTWLVQSSGGLAGNGQGKFSIYDATASDYRFTIDADGDVGIGNNDPLSKLHVTGRVIRIDSGSGGLEFWNNASFFGKVGIITDAPGTTSNNDILIKGDLDRHIIFQTNGSNERLRIDKDGKVGIGTTNTQAQLHVVGDVLVAAGSSTDQYITQKAYEVNNGTLSWEGSAGQLFSITNNLTSGSLFSVNDVSGIPSIDVDADGTILLAPYGRSDIGLVGIGTTAPTSKLTVHGDARFTGVITSTSYDTEYTRTGSVIFTSSTIDSIGIHSTLSSSVYRSVEYTIQATEGTNYHATKIIALHDGTTAYHSEYGTIYNNQLVALFNVDISGGNIRLVSTASTSNSTNYTINFTATKI